MTPCFPVGPPYPSVWVFAHTWAYSFAYPCHVHAETREGCWVSSFIVLHLSFSDRVSHWTESLPLRLDWLASKRQEPPSISLPLLGLQVRAVMHMVHGCWWFKLISSYLHNFYSWRYHPGAQGTTFNHPLHCILRVFVFLLPRAPWVMCGNGAWISLNLKSWWFSIFSLLNSVLFLSLYFS